MLGSFQDAEDHVQDTMLRAWRRLSIFEGRSSFRAWLYRIATNACLDTLRRAHDRVVPSGVAVPSEIPWLQPYPDRLLDTAAPSSDQPDVVIVAKETIELAFLAAIQLLSANQRAVLILRDVLGWSANEAADLLDTSVASVNSALQRAGSPCRSNNRSGEATGLRSRVRAKTSVPCSTGTWRPTSERTRRAWSSCCARTYGSRCRRSPRATRDARRSRRSSRQRSVPDASETSSWCQSGANRQPAAANYLRRPVDTVFRALSLDVLRIENGELVEITTFEPKFFPAFGLPPSL
jgi:RNA polymerase sigma factor (sigma-70 family)